MSRSFDYAACGLANRNGSDSRSRKRHLPFGLLLPRDELVEVALLSVLGFLLIEQREVLIVELLEPFVPRDRLQLAATAVAREIEAEHAGVPAPARAADASRLAVTRFRPPSDEFVVGRHLRGAAPAVRSRAAAAATGAR